MLRDCIFVAASFTGSCTALVLQNGTDIWYRDSRGLSVEQMAALEATLAQGLTLESNIRLQQEYGLQVIWALPLVDGFDHAVGTLCVLSHTALSLTTNHREGLRLLADHIQTILASDQQKKETRAIPRAPSASSFVPGLAHELRNSIFGISANLDAFEARFIDQHEVRKYGAIIRKGLDRLKTFVEELQEYGDPQRFSWAERPMEPLLREAIEHHKLQAASNGIDLLLHVEGPLPILNVDELRLRAAFIHLIDLVLQQEQAGDRVVLHVATRLHGERSVICGHLDSSHLRLKEIDLARLFEPFYYRASGLGRLALPGARRVFESHGGTLTAGPGPEGGLRISFLLPADLTYPLPSDGLP